MNSLAVCFTMKLMRTTQEIISSHYLIIRSHKIKLSNERVILQTKSIWNQK